MRNDLFATAVAIVLFLSQTACGAEREPVIDTQSGPIAVETIASGLNDPWSLAFLPDGRFLITQRSGRIRIVTRAGNISAPLAGVPDVYSSGQGGLLDVALAPILRQADSSTSRSANRVRAVLRPRSLGRA